MLVIREKFLDRVEQSFLIFKSEFKNLIIPYLVFNIFFIVILPALGVLFFSHSIDLESLTNGTAGQDTSIAIALGVSLGLVFLIFYLTALIPLQLYGIRTVTRSIRGEKNNISENIMYALENIGKSFQTYWYIFAYVFLIPSLLFIFGGISFVTSLLIREESIIHILSIVGITSIIFSIILAVVFGITRGLRSAFALISAVESDSYSKENFKESISTTHGKLLRIFWNIAGVGFLGSLIVSSISKIGTSFVFYSKDFSWISELENVSLDNTVNTADIQEILGSFTDFSMISFINKIFQNTLSTTLGIFILIFMIVLYYRLQYEFTGSSKNKKNNLTEKSEEKIIEL